MKCAYCGAKIKKVPNCPQCGAPVYYGSVYPPPVPSPYPPPQAPYPPQPVAYAPTPSAPAPAETAGFPQSMEAPPPPPPPVVHPQPEAQYQFQQPQAPYAAPMPPQPQGLQPIMSLKATNGYITVFHDYVVFSRNSLAGYTAQGAAGARTYYYRDIALVEYRKPNLAANGYLKIVLAGTNDVRSGTRSSTPRAVAQDPNTMVLRAFKSSVPVESEKIYNFIQRRVHEIKTAPPPAPVFAPPEPASNADEIVKYKQLMDQGIITAEEFEAKKRQLLGI